MIECNANAYPVEVDNGFGKARTWRIWIPWKSPELRGNYATRERAEAAIERARTRRKETFKVILKWEP